MSAVANFLTQSGRFFLPRAPGSGSDFQTVTIPDKPWTIEAATEEMFRLRYDMRRALKQLRDKEMSVHTRIMLVDIILTEALGEPLNGG